MIELLLLVHLAATLSMVGVIWFVQVVHYPLFEQVGATGFPAYSATHSRLTGFVFGPPMLLEAATALGLVIRRPDGVSAALAWTGLVLLALVWTSTATLQAPRHRTLGRGFDPASHIFLVASNWVRTAAWSVRGLVTIDMAVQAT